MRSFLKFIDQRSTSTLVLIISDSFFFALSYFASYYLRNFFGETQIQELSIYLQVFPVVLTIMLISFSFFGLYQKQKRITPLHELNLLIKAITLTTILIMAFSFLRKYDYSRAFVILLWLSSMFFLKLGRYLIRKIKTWLYTKNIGLNRILVVGQTNESLQIAKQLARFEDFGYRVVGYIAKKNPSSTQKDFRLKYLGKLEELPKIIKKRKIQEVYIADQSISHEEILNLIQNCEDLEVRFKIATDIFEIVTGDVSLNDLEGVPSIDLKRRSNTPFYDFFKRILDIVLSTIALILFSPFWLIITALIRFLYGSSAIFKQERVGLNGKKFTFYKFRSMYENTPTNTYAPKSSSDPRITPLGKFIRRFSLDEMPQLLNVLKGEMSLVGPRPEMSFIVEKYTHWQRRRLEVKPGLTGLWQILGRKDLPLHENIEYDFYYIKNRSFLLDIIIIIKTIAVVILGKGAY